MKKIPVISAVDYRNFGYHEKIQNVTHIINIICLRFLDYLMPITSLYIKLKNGKSYVISENIP